MAGATSVMTHGGNASEHKKRCRMVKTTCCLAALHLMEKGQLRQNTKERSADSLELRGKHMNYTWHSEIQEVLVEVGDALLEHLCIDDADLTSLYSLVHDRRRQLQKVSR